MNMKNVGSPYFNNSKDTNNYQEENASITQNQLNQLHHSKNK